MSNHKRTLPFLCNPTDFLCPSLSLLRHLLKSKVPFLRLFGGLERYRTPAQPDTVEKCCTTVCETVKINKYSKYITVKLGGRIKYSWVERFTFQVWYLITTRVFFLTINHFLGKVLFRTSFCCDLLANVTHLLSQLFFDWLCDRHSTKVHLLGKKVDSNCQYERLRLLNMSRINESSNCKIQHTCQL